MVGCEKRERNRVGWEMDLSEEWYKGNGMGVPEGSGVKKGVRGKTGADRERSGVPAGTETEA